SQIKHAISFYNLHITPELHLYAVKSLRDLLLMGIELLTENTMIQVISLLKHNRTPLRDLGAEYFDKPGWLDLAYFGDSVYGVSTNTVLFLWVFYCFFHGRHGMSVLQKGVRCLTMARALRVITFSITVLPNPNEECSFTGPIDPFNLSPDTIQHGSVLDAFCKTY
ncbi:unnamed protein product, partial [Didymodactylos carnosus]